MVSRETAKIPFKTLPHGPVGTMFSCYCGAAHNSTTARASTETHYRRLLFETILLLSSLRVEVMLENNTFEVAEIAVRFAGY